MTNQSELALRQMQQELRSQPAKLNNLQRREQAAKVMQLRRAGASYEQIAEQVGIQKSVAYKIVDRQITRASTRFNQDSDHVRQLELERLDAMLLKAWTVMAALPVADVDGLAKIQKSILDIMARRAKYMGLDKEVPFAQVNVNIQNGEQYLPVLKGATVSELEELRQKYLAIKIRNDEQIVNAAAELQHESDEPEAEQPTAPIPI